MTAQQPITLIRHHHNAVEESDGAVMHLRSLGHNLEFRSPFDGDLLDIGPGGVTPTIIYGGSQNVSTLDRHPELSQELRWIEACLKSEMPLLGICLGAQLIAHVLGAAVKARDPRECEFGFYEISPTSNASDDQSLLPEPMMFMQAHYEEFELPHAAVRLARSERYECQAFKSGNNCFAVQFHPEVTRPILDDWQADSWSDLMFDTAGAQSVAIQNELATANIDRQGQWLGRRLLDLFGKNTAIDEVESGLGTHS